MQNNNNTKKKENIFSAFPKISSSFWFWGPFGLGILFTLLSISGEGFLFASTQFSVIPSKGTLSDKFQSGDFDFWDILTFVAHLIKISGILGGAIYMIMNLIAGFQYTIGAMAGDKEMGKKTMTNAFIGFAMVIFSWMIVDIVIAFLTES